VLPDESTGQGPRTLASKLSRCKEGMAHFLPFLPAEALAKVGMVQILLSITRVAPRPVRAKPLDLLLIIFNVNNNEVLLFWFFY